MAVLRLAFVFIVASGLVWLLWVANFNEGEPDLRNAVNVIASVDATLLGFLVSAGALLYAVANTRLVRNLQRTGHFGQLVHDLFIDAGAFLVALVISLVCLFLSATSTPIIKITPLTTLELAIYVLVFANAVAFQLLIPVGWKMWLILTSLSPDDPQELE